MAEKDELMQLMGNNVRKYRMERKMTQRQLADLVNYDNSAITRIEGGARSMSVATLRAMAQALHVSCDALVFGDCPDVHINNIISMLQGQSQESLEHIERVVELLLREYGEAEHPAQ